ncbi:MAG: type III pantothenate kinase [Gemmataceae bacterium]|nr:type III pantothenate kinase [Gemmataceae bacterium]
MIPDMVADVGNTRVKWGLGQAFHTFRNYSLPPDPVVWEETRAAMSPERFRWVVASVQPARAEKFLEWLKGRGDEAILLRHEHLTLKTNVHAPDRVGIDRLLNAVAAIDVLEPRQSAILVDAGSAVTVDYLDEAHVFQGGTIFPGLDLMAKALHDHTALLPLVEMRRGPLLMPPGKTTEEAIRAGILSAVAGGIVEIIKTYRSNASADAKLFATGGQSPLLAGVLGWDKEPWPEMTLHGILVAARGLP